MSRLSQALLFLPVLCSSILLPVAHAQSPIKQVIITNVEARVEEAGPVQVSAFVSVLDEENRPVSGLMAADFSLSENSLAIDPKLLTVVPSTDPLRVALLIDTSQQMAEPGSDNTRVMDTAKKAGIAFIEGLREGDEVAIYGFNSQLQLQHDFTYDHNMAIDQGVTKLDVQETEAVCFFDALQQIVEPLTAVAGRQRVVVALVGGPVVPIEGTCGSTTAQDVLDTTNRSPVPIFTVALGDAPEETIQKLSQDSGGAVLAATDPVAFTDLLTLLARQLTQHYKISYPSQAPAGWAKLIIFEKSSQQSARRQVLIPARSQVTPTLPPKFSVDLVIDQPAPERVAVKLNVPEDITLVKTELYLNDKLVKKLETPPFDQFNLEVNEIGAGKHKLRVEATDQNGVTASTEVELSLTMSPTSLPTTSPTLQPVSAAPTPSNEPEAATTIPVLSLVLAIAGLILLLVLVGLIGAGIFFFLKQPKPTYQAAPVPPPPQPFEPAITQIDNMSMTLIDEPEGNQTLISYPDSEIPPRPAKLTVVSGHTLVSRSEFELVQKETKIGRNTDKESLNDLAVQAKEVSRSHARIIYRDQNYFIQDLNSSSGTHINGIKINALQEVKLQDGDEITIGPRLRLKFESPDDSGDKTLWDQNLDNLRPADINSDPFKTIYD